MEKPFGRDLAGAVALNQTLHQSFAEEQIYRIDHYMGKETVQNLLALRFANAIFEPIWNRRYVDSIQITVAEELGVEHRGSFYETAGALRDIVQNHVMQVLALTCMEPPAHIEAQSIRDEKVKLLQAVVIPSVDAAVGAAVRAQYTAGMVNGQEVVGYREEPDVDPHSRVETYVAMKLTVDNWRWAGVPIYIRTGKRLPKRATEVTLQFQRVPHQAFAGALTRDLQPNSLILRIQPDDGICLRFGAKVPGEAFRVRSVGMDFSYAETFPGPAADGYERLLHDAMMGDATLFIRTDEVEQAWRIVDPFLDGLVRGRGPPGPLPGRHLGAARSRAPAGRRSAPLGRSVSPGPLETENIRIVDDVADRFAQTVLDSFARRAEPGFTFVLSGGSTARRCYERLADIGAAAIDWSVVDVLMGDERCVPADDPDANQRLVRRVAARPGGAGGRLPSHGPAPTSTTSTGCWPGSPPSIWSISVSVPTATPLRSSPARPDWRPRRDGWPSSTPIRAVGTPTSG